MNEYLAQEMKYMASDAIEHLQKHVFAIVEIRLFEDQIEEGKKIMGEIVPPDLMKRIKFFPKYAG